MPTSTVVKFAVGFEGVLTGTSTNTALTTAVGREAILTSTTGSGFQVYERFRVPLTITSGATTTLDLTSGLTNPLGESISGADNFDEVLGVLVQHDADSASATIEAFGGASSNLFQGPWNATAKATLVPGKWIAFGITSDLTGDTVDASHCNIDLKNTGAADATVNVIILGVV